MIEMAEVFAIKRQANTSTAVASGVAVSCTEQTLLRLPESQGAKLLDS